MCLYGNYQKIKVNLTSKKDREILVDACIADEIKELNMMEIMTVGCCCSHGEAGEIEKYSNGFGEWKERKMPAHVLFKEESLSTMTTLQYVCHPYYEADGTYLGLYIGYLKTGCNTIDECKQWHELYGIPYKKNGGVLNV